METAFLSKVDIKQFDNENKFNKRIKKQDEKLGEIYKGIEEISDTIQSNSATTEERAAASQELTAQAETLNSMMEHFKLRN